MPTLGVIVAILRDEQIVVVKQASFAHWSLPGGGVDAGESLAQAAIREAREETGLEVRLTRLVGVYSWPRWRRGGNHEILFAARPVGGVLRPIADDVLEARAVDPDHLPEPFAWWHRQALQDALSGVSGFAWSLDLAWPFADDSLQPLLDLYAQSSLSWEELVQREGQRFGTRGQLREVDGA
jgi:8-oxo-dGTP diphosphatase